MSTTGDEPLAVARRFYDAFARGDWPELLACFDENVVADLTEIGIPGLGRHEGRDTFRAAWEEWRGAWERYDVEVEDLIASGDHVLALTRVRGKSKGLGVETELSGADVLTVRDGVIAGIAIYADRDAARREAGLG